MSKLHYYNYPGWGEYAAENFGYAQAVRVGDRWELSGQGGWDEEMNVPEDEETQIDNAFKNIEKALKHAGVKDPFKQVFKIVSYHVGLADRHVEVMVKYFKKCMPDHKPIWTLLGVERLGLESMKVEIDAVAIVEGKE